MLHKLCNGWLSFGPTSLISKPYTSAMGAQNGHQGMHSLTRHMVVFAVQVAEGLRRFGVNEATKHVLVATFNTNPDQVTPPEHSDSTQSSAAAQLPTCKIITWPPSAHYLQLDVTAATATCADCALWQVHLQWP
jgi:hypothetical protein